MTSFKGFEKKGKKTRERNNERYFLKTGKVFSRKQQQKNIFVKRERKEFS